MDMSFGEKLRALRKERYLSQTEVAEYLTARGFPVLTQAVSKWEKNTTVPNARQFLELCSLYRVRDAVHTFASPEKRENTGRILPLYTLSVSAGTGEWLDGADFEPVEVGEEVSTLADFGVRIAGDSMEPRFVSGQIVWVRRQSELKTGEIGIFLYNGAGYCKKLFRSGDTTELHSLNPRYMPIRVEETDELRLFGKVVG